MIRFLKRLLTFVPFKVLVVATFFVPFFVPSHAHAGAFLEPYAGYQTGTFSSNGAEFALTSPIVGLRAAYTLSRFFAGLDYDSAFSGTMVRSTNNKKFDISGSRLFLVGGATLGPLRAFAAYGVLNSFGTVGPTGSSNTYGGAVSKFGFGVRLWRVALNAEYLTAYYDKVNSGPVAAQATAYVFDLSVPISF